MGVAMLEKAIKPQLQSTRDGMGDVGVFGFKFSSLISFDWLLALVLMPLLTYIFFQLCFVLTDFYGKLAGMADDEIDDIMDAPTDDLFGDPKMVAARRIAARALQRSVRKKRSSSKSSGGSDIEEAPSDAFADAFKQIFKA